MKRALILPNMITSFGLACGLFVIFRVAMVTESNFALLQLLAMVLLLAAFADLLDGMVARAVKGESSFGLTFDSLSDAISFGVAPALLFLSTVKLDGSRFELFCYIGAAMIYTICGVLRLVRFNIKQGIDTEEKYKAFIGLPIPSAAFAFISINLLLNAPFFIDRIPVSLEARGWILSVLAVILAFLMLSKVRFMSVKSFNLKLRPFMIVVLGSLFMVCVLYGFLHNFTLLLLIGVWGYIVSSLIIGAFSRYKN